MILKYYLYNKYQFFTILYICKCYNNIIYKIDVNVIYKIDVNVIYNIDVTVI